MHPTDIDLLIQPADAAAVLAVAGTEGFRIEAHPMKFRDGMELRRVSKVDAGDLLTLDLLLVNDDLESVWSSRVRIETERGGLWTVSRDAFIQMKSAAGRPQDLADIQRLEELDR